MEQERGKIPKAEVMEQFENLPPAWKEKVCEILTGSPTGHPDEHNQEHWMLIYYVSTLYDADLAKAAEWLDAQGDTYKQALAQHVTGDPNGTVDFTNPAFADRHVWEQWLIQKAGLETTGRFATVFVDVYDKQLKPGTKLPDISVPIPTSGDIIKNISGALHSAKQKQAHFSLLQTQLGTIIYVARQYHLSVQPLLYKLLTAGDKLERVLRTPAKKAVPAGPNGPEIPATDEILIDLVTLNVELIEFFDAVEAKKKASTSALRAPGQPMAGSEVVYLCTKKEFGTTKRDDALERATTENTAHFAVGLTSVDFGGIGRVKTSGIVQRAKDEAGRAGKMAVGFAKDLLRSGAGSVLKEFPIFAGLDAGSGDHLDHQLKDVPTPKVAELIGYLRYVATEKRAEAKIKGGVKVTGLDELQQFVRAMEDILAERLKTEILKGDAKDAWKRTSSVLTDNLFDPLKHVAHDPRKIKEHLKHIKAPEHAHPKESSGIVSLVRDQFKKYGLLGTIAHFADIRELWQDLTKKSKGGGDSAKKPDGGGHDPPH